MKQFPLFGLGQQGKSPTITAQRHLNLYAEITPEGEKSRVAFYGTPGTTLRTTFGDTPVRGWIAVDSLYYAVHRGKFYSVNNAGTKTELGSLNTTTGFVDMEFDGSVILIVDGTNGYTYTVATTTFAQIADVDFPNGARTCGWLDGHFIVDEGAGSDLIFISPDGSAWDALDFASAESAPDGLVRVFVDHGEVILAGETNTEFWGNIGQGDFPLAPIKGATSSTGLAALRSMTKFNDGVAFLGKNAQGQVQVMFLKGYTAVPISSQELDSLINAYATVSDATAYAYMWGGHPMLQLNFPNAEKTWLLDASTGLWSPLEYGLNGGRHRGEMHLDFLNKPLICDYENGNVYELADVYTDNGTAIVREIVGRHLHADGSRLIVDELYVDMETGVGLVSGQGSNPQAMLSVSKNNGKTWGNELWASMGQIGEYAERLVWRRLGIGRDWLFKIRITDAVKTVFTFAAIKAERVE
jgi:hypothetical protein